MSLIARAFILKPASTSRSSHAAYCAAVGVDATPSGFSHSRAGGLTSSEVCRFRSNDVLLFDPRLSEFIGG